MDDQIDFFHEFDSNFQICILDDLVYHNVNMFQAVECHGGYYVEKAAFIYKIDSGAIIAQGEDAIDHEIPPDCAYIDNIVESLNSLHHQSTRPPLFSAIAHYIQNLITNSNQYNQVNPNRIFFTLIVPNEWDRESDIHHLLLTPLLKEAGILTHQVLFITQLEATFAHLQFDTFSRCPPFIGRENRCIRIRLNMSKTGWIESEVIFLQFKEDYYASMVDQRYFVPRVAVIKHCQLFQPEFELILVSFRTWLAQEGLKMERLLNGPVQFINADGTIYPDLLDYVSNMVIWKILNYMENDCNRLEDDYYDSNLDNYFDMSVIEYILSKEFLAQGLDFLYRRLTHQLSAIVNFAQQQSKEHGFFRKYIVLAPVESDHALLNLFYRFVKQDCHKIHPENAFWIDNFSISMFTGASFLIERKAVISNTMLTPIVVAESERHVNRIGLPIHYKLTEPIYKDTPDHVIYIDLSSLESTKIRRDTIDKQGYIIHSCPIDIPNKKLSSISNFFKSKNILINQTSIEPKRSRGLKASWIKRAQPSSISSHLDHYLSELVHNNLPRTSHVICLPQRLKRLATVHLARCVDPGDEAVKRALLAEPVKPPLYYLHAHMSHHDVYLKLYQALDVTRSDAVRQESASVLVKDRFIEYEEVHGQVAERFWNHLSSLEDNSTFLCGEVLNVKCFEVFKIKFVKFLKENLFEGDQSLYYSTIHQIKVDENCYVQFSTQHVIEIGIVPVLQQVVLVMASTIADSNIFNDYNTVGRMFVTGDFLKTKQFNPIFHNCIMNTMNETFEKVLGGKSHRTKYRILIDTSHESGPSQTELSLLEKHFCYDYFLKGEPRIVPSTTYYIKNGTHTQGDLYNTCLGIKSHFRHGYSYAVMVRGVPFTKERLTIDLGDLPPDSYPDIYIYGFKEPCEEENANYSDKMHTLKLIDTSLSFDYMNSIKPTVEIQFLHHLGCISITIEYYRNDQENKIIYKKHMQVVGERLTLKYF